MTMTTEIDNNCDDDNNTDDLLVIGDEGNDAMIDN